ncbi:MAG: CDP-alcohol phosphatidyltransferase family protein [Hyphomicrobium sp.]|nr:CDP-alcohol phosphatidyltransferase family protein [Hyphomicrobium sp.]
MTLYELKPRFQTLLRPLVRGLHGRGATANQVTLAAAAGSVLTGTIAAYAGPSHPSIFMLYPVWLLIRMALNAVDGMLAREFGQKSELGMFLNELCDVISDTALILPLALVAPFSAAHCVIFASAAVLTEFAGALAPAVGASRRYDGPLGKSDRALVLGAVGLWFAVTGSLPAWSFAIMPFLIVLSIFTVFNRIRGALREASDLHMKG